MTQIEKLEKILIESLQTNLNELIRIWDYVGYCDWECNERTQNVVKRFQSVLLEIINDENLARLQIEQKIECKRKKIAELSLQLGLSPYLPERGLTTSELMKALENKSDELFQQKRARCERYTWLRLQILHLADLMPDMPEISQKVGSNFQTIYPSICPLNGGGDQENLKDINYSNSPESLDNSVLDTIQNIPDEKLTTELVELYDELQTVYKPLAAQHASLRDDIARVAADILYQPQTDKEIEILNIVGLRHLCTNANLASTPGVVRKASTLSKTVSSTTSQQSKSSSPTSSPTSSPSKTSENASPKHLTNGVTNGYETVKNYEPIVNNEILQWLTDWRLRLVKEKARLVGTCEELRTYLVQMWQRLDKPENEQKIFLTTYSGYKPDVLEALQEEVDRCQQMKWENMKTYVHRLETEALRLAKLCCVDENIIELPKEMDHSDPEIMINHLETVLEKLNQTYSLYRPVYESISVYETCWKQLMDVETRLKDPAIFSNRGGILLKTEKEKKRLLKEVERTEREAQQAIEQYELKSKSPFILSSGKTFLEHVSERWSNYKLARDTPRSRRSVNVSHSNNTRPGSGAMIGSSVTPS